MSQSSDIEAAKRDAGEARFLIDHMSAGSHSRHILENVETIVLEWFRDKAVEFVRAVNVEINKRRSSNEGGHE